MSLIFAEAFDNICEHQKLWMPYKTIQSKMISKTEGSVSFSSVVDYEIRKILKLKNNS
jgi:hypothetical protein